MDIENLDTGQEFDQLPDTFTIFITEFQTAGRPYQIFEGKSEGVSEMCKVIEDMPTQERKETMVEIAQRMLEAGRYALQEIVSISGLSLDEVKKLQAGQSA